MLNAVVYIVYIESVGRSPSQLIESSGEELGHKNKMHRLQLHRLLSSSGPLFAFCLFISMQSLSVVCNTQKKSNMHIAYLQFWLNLGKFDCREDEAQTLKHRHTHAHPM